MALSFGLAKKVIESGPYNFGIALPLICAFYIANDPPAVSVWDYQLSAGISAAINCAAISLLYVVSLYMFTLAGALSPLAHDSRGAKVIVGIFAGEILLSFVFAERTPGIAFIFGGMGVVYLLLSRFDEGNLSTVIVTITGVAIALFCSTVGILWMFERFLFPDAVAYVLGLERIDHGTAHLGGAALIATAYVAFYAVFNVAELASPPR